jgi:soluble lytic murein transglycosylase
MPSRFLGRALLAGFLLAPVTLPLIGLALAPTAMAAPQVSQAAVNAAALALKGNFPAAGAAARQSGDEAAIKLVELFYLRDHWDEAGYGRIMAFLNVAPKWPLTETLQKRAEQALYKNGEPAQVVLGHFNKRKPVTPEGMLALARAQTAAGNSDEARAWLRRAWNLPDVSAALEQSVIREFGGMLSADDHKRRLWRLIYAQETNAAVRHAKRLPGDYQKAAAVAQALMRGTSGAEKRYSGLPSALRAEPAMKYALVRLLRKQEKYAKARAILAEIPADAGDTEAWWTERRIIARHSVGVSHRDSAGAAYKIARNHGLASGNSAIEAEFLAGWIALRYLGKPEIGLKHFAKLEELATTRTERARAFYWMGRSHAALGQKGSARSAYEQASQFSTIYYGQLAREQIGLGNVPEDINSGQSSAAAKAKVDRDEVARAFQMVRKADGKNALYTFLWSLSQRFNTEDEMNAVAALVNDAGGPTMAVRLAKAAGQRGIDIDAWSYPVRALPNWQQIGKPVEKALVYGLSRQESEFDPNAGSKVGAQGLMQLMPGTAKIIARQYRLPFAASKLKSDPAYNVKLGAAHLADLVAEYNGSYVLTLVAYNAGPRRSREWVAEYGDLRGGKVDPIDWVESIPFQETRQYVQKVLQNVHVYRSRLAPKTVRPMTADLMRGAPSAINVAATSDSGTSGCAGGSITDLISSCD